MADALTCECGKTTACGQPNCHHPLRDMAVLSECGNYRYRLERDIGTADSLPLFGPSQPLLWVMCNPSTADARDDDATIRKVRGFSKLAGYTRVVVVNVVAFRAREPSDLKALSRAVALGPWNHDHVAQAAMFAHKIVVAWGKALPKRLLPCAGEVIDILRTTAADKPLHCLGTTADGTPRHPLMVAYKQEIVEWQR